MGFTKGEQNLLPLSLPGAGGLITEVSEAVRNSSEFPGLILPEKVSGREWPYLHISREIAREQNLKERKKNKNAAVTHLIAGKEGWLATEMAGSNTRTNLLHGRGVYSVLGYKTKYCQSGE